LIWVNAEQLSKELANDSLNSYVLKNFITSLYVAFEFFDVIKKPNKYTSPLVIFLSGKAWGISAISKFKFGFLVFIYSTSDPRPK
jgi:hypothetical protein